jgi:hypothetical protein
MVTCDLGLVGVDERSAAHDVATSDDEALDPVRRRQNEAGDQVPGSPELETVRSPDGKVGALAGLERADVVAPEHGGASPCPEVESFARGHRFGPAAATRDEERQLDVEEQVAALVRR